MDGGAFVGCGSGLVDGVAVGGRGRGVHSEGLFWGVWLGGLWVGEEGLDLRLGRVERKRLSGGGGVVVAVGEVLWTVGSEAVGRKIFSSV